MTGQLQSAKEEQLDQIAEMQAGRGRVESAVVGDRLAGEKRL
jgi:hypothetical protein